MMKIGRGHRSHAWIAREERDHQHFFQRLEKEKGHGIGCCELRNR